MILCFLSADCSLLKGAGSASTSSAAVTAAKAVVAAKKKQNHDDPAVVIVTASTAIAAAVVATAAHQDDDPEDTVAGAASKKAGSIAASAVVAASATIVASTATVVVTSTVCSSQITHYKILQLFVYNSFYVDRMSGVKKYPVANRGLFDMHCHIVPAVDDGAQSVKEAFAMLQMEYDQGVRKIIVTPHFRREMFETPSEIIKKHFLVLRRLAEKIGPDFKVFLGCEFHANVEMLDYLRSDKVYSMAGSRYVLTEFSSSTEEKYISDRIYELLSGGYRPIIAHIERYRCMHDLDFVEHLVNKGALMQVNADSVIGKNGHAAKKYCGKLLEEELVSYIGSDCHGSKRRVTRIGDAYAYVTKKMGRQMADEIFIDNPQEILDNAKHCMAAAHR